MKLFSTIKGIALTVLIFLFSSNANSQLCEWRLTNVVYSSVDPDGGSTPAVGTVSFDLQIRTTAGSIANVSGISTGWSWQSVNAALPTGPAPIPTCGTNSVSQPSNVTMLAPFSTNGFTYNNVNQCSGVVSYSTGGQTFDRRSAGTVDGGTITLTTAWTDVFRVTLWSLSNSGQYAGFAALNSTGLGTPGPFGTYAISDVNADEYQANSLTFTAPLALRPPIVTPVIFTYFNADCNDKGALLTWETATEENADYYEVQRSENGTDWKTVDKVDASGNSAIARQYQYLDLEGGNVQYRLRQVDIDGKATYTSIRRTSCEGKSFSSTLYPVPARDKMTLVVRSERAVTTNLQILDMNGRIVKQMRTNINNGNTNIIIDVNSLPQGEYMLMSSDPSVRINKKFVVAR